MNKPIGIGSTIWVFDSNRRVYGDSKSGPIYREHWVPRKIEGETSRSWIVGWNHKIPKKGCLGVAFTEREVEDSVWFHEHRYKIGSQVQSLQCIETLRAVAKLIGYNA